MVCCQGVVGRSAVAMVTELVLDNRKIIDRITTEHIKMFVQLLDKTMVSVARDRCLPLLICCCHVWCMCDMELLVHHHSISVCVWFQDYCFLDLLAVLCVSNGLPIPANQNAVADIWLQNTVTPTAAAAQLIVS